MTTIKKRKGMRVRVKRLRPSLNFIRYFSNYNPNLIQGTILVIRVTRVMKQKAAMVYTKPFCSMMRS